MLKALMNHAGRAKSLLAASMLVVLLALGSAGPVHAAGLVVSSAVIPLSGFVGDIQIQGWLHVVSQYPSDPTLPATTHANLPPIDVVATDSFGTNYLAHGAGLASLVCYPSDPCRPTISGFNLLRLPPKNGIPPNPILPIPFSLLLNLKLNSDGTLNASESNATVPE